MDNEFWESEELEAAEGSELESDETEDEMSDLADQVSEELQSQEDEDAEDAELLSNARLRLEQGKLYEMMLKHDLFGSVDADPRAVTNVQREIRTFIKERLEVLLGLKPDPKLQPRQEQIQTVQSSQFTDLEAELLKRFLAKLSKGATERVEQADPRPVVTPVSSPQSSGLRQINSSGQQRPMALRQNVQSPLKAKEPPSQVRAPNPKLKKILEEQFGENEMPLGKPAHKLKRSELMERNKRIAQRQASRKASSVNQLPPPNADQEAAIMMQHVMARNESLQQSGVNPLSLAVGKALASKVEQSE